MSENYRALIQAFVDEMERQKADFVDFVNSCVPTPVGADELEKFARIYGVKETAGALEIIEAVLGHPDEAARRKAESQKRAAAWAAILQLMEASDRDKIEIDIAEVRDIVAVLEGLA